jgi:uncharacterized 2Fe-2S/4Fe-4S cluster protein (DUF4445 family)
MFKIEVEPIGKRVTLNSPKNGLEALIDAGIGLKSVCAGKGTCGKCRIIILDNAAKEPTDTESKSLNKDEIDHGVRLACQQTFDRNLNIYIPAASLTEEQKLQVSGEESDIVIDPVFKKYYIEMDTPTLSDMESDFSRIKNTILKTHGHGVSGIDPEVLKNMPDILRKNSWKVTVTVRNGEVIFIEGGDRSKNAYGVAIDLGTTKIAVLLVDLFTGNTIGKKGVMNPQISFGEDVMSRINFAMQDDGSAAKIKKVVLDQINRTVSALAAESEIGVDKIIECTIVGNTAMHHLLLGLPVKQLGLSPFIALTDKKLDIKAREAGIIISPGAYVYLLPPIAGFVGSDHLAMILASDISDKKGNYLGIDIGTNTEIVLKSKKGMESVSTASGPAFEGAHIRFGMRAAPGAIERVLIEPGTCRPLIQTINDKKPVGICGSGILDAVAELLKAGVINNRGKFQVGTGCICKDKKETLQYILDPEGFRQNNCKKNDTNNKGKENSEEIEILTCMDEQVSINQKDIVEIQLAKSAIRTGIDVLLENAGIDFSRLDGIIIAGAFGSYIDPKNVVNIGMFPRVSLKKIHQIGNAAAVGAKMILLSKELRAKAEEVAEKVNYLELTVFPTFADHFAKSTIFPEPAEII